MKQLARYTIIILATLTGLLLTWQFRFVIPLILLSLGVAAAFHPLVDFFTLRHIQRSIALVLSYLLVFGLVLGLIWLMSGSLIADIRQWSNQIAIRYDEIQTQWPNSSLGFQRLLAGQLPPPEELFAEMTDTEGIQNLIGITTNLSKFFGGLVLVVILSMYWSADSLHFERVILSLIDLEKRQVARTLWAKIEFGIGAYIRGEFVQSLLIGILLWLGYYFIGIEYPTLLAGVGAVLWLVPWVGAVIVIGLPVLSGMGGQPGLGIIAGIYTACIFLVLEYVWPRISSRKNYNPILLILVMLFMIEAFGVLSFIFAPLVTAVIQITFMHLVRPPYPSSKTYFDISSQYQDYTLIDLRQRLDQIRGLLSENEKMIVPEVLNLSTRLETLIDEADPHLSEDVEGTETYAV